MASSAFNWEALFDGLTPSLAALVVASIVIIISLSLERRQKIPFQFVAFASALVFSYWYLLNHINRSQLTTLWTGFIDLPSNGRFVLSFAVIVLAYFGAGLYIGPEDTPSQRTSTTHTKSTYITPASIDMDTSFDLPVNPPEDDRVFFEQFLNKLQQEILVDVRTTYEMPEEAYQWVDRMISYNVAGGKMNRGLTVLDAYRRLKQGPITLKERCQAAALGWGIEFLQAFFLVADDIMDDSITRRGQPCWFRNEDIKLIAINDSFLLESFVYKILKKYFGQESYYYQLVDLFLETTRQTEFGQLLDLTSQPLSGALDLKRYTIERYFKIVRYKTAFYSFYLPVALAMIMSGLENRKVYHQAKEILLTMGEYFQIQDDYLDCYGAPEVIGKVGTDIEDKKCSWLVVQALARANPAHKKILQDNYGVHDPLKVATIKKLYREMELEQLFKSYEESSYQSIVQLVEEVTDMDRGIFLDFIKKIYKRTK